MAALWRAWPACAVERCPLEPTCGDAACADCLGVLLASATATCPAALNATSNGRGAAWAHIHASTLWALVCLASILLCVCIVLSVGCIREGGLAAAASGPRGMFFLGRRHEA